MLVMRYVYFVVVFSFTWNKKVIILHKNFQEDIEPECQGSLKKTPMKKKSRSSESSNSEKIGQTNSDDFPSPSKKRKKR